jgi:DNA glycosylase AlkZ-like
MTDRTWDCGPACRTSRRTSCGTDRGTSGGTATPDAQHHASGQCAGLPELARVVLPARRRVQRTLRRGTEGVDRDALLRQARRLLEEQPRTRSQLGRLLAERWPDADPNALAYAATHHIALCQVPPRGIWGKNGATAWAPVETWLGAPLRSVPVDAPVLRYLGAFGPASVADIQLWSGLTRLSEVVERLPLRTFRGEAEQALYDLPDAARPSEDMPAPPRFLPEYDNLLLSHKDRTRVILDNRSVPLPPGNGATAGTFLVSCA